MLGVSASAYAWVLALVTVIQGHTIILDYGLKWRRILNIRVDGFSECVHTLSWDAVLSVQQQSDSASLHCEFSREGVLSLAAVAHGSAAPSPVLAAMLARQEELEALGQS